MATSGTFPTNTTMATSSFVNELQLQVPSPVEAIKVSIRNFCSVYADAFSVVKEFVEAACRTGSTRAIVRLSRRHVGCGGEESEDCDCERTVKMLAAILSSLGYRITVHWNRVHGSSAVQEYNHGFGEQVLDSVETPDASTSSHHSRWEVSWTHLIDGTLFLPILRVM